MRYPQRQTLAESTLRRLIREQISVLYEDAKTDKAMRGQAIDVYKDLIRYLKNDGQLLKDKSYYPFVKTSDFTDLLDDNLRMVFMKKKRGTEAGYNPSKYAPKITLYILDKDFRSLSNDELRHKIIRELQDKYTSFIHEYIHYLDDMRIEMAITDLISYYPQKKADPNHYDRYFSDPFEINAHLQSWLAQIQHLTEDDDLLRSFMEQDWNGSFKGFKSWFFDEYVDKRMESAMDKDQYRRFINRLYGYWELLEDEYRQ